MKWYRYTVMGNFENEIMINSRFEVLKKKEV